MLTVKYASHIVVDPASQNVQKSDLKKSRLCPMWDQSDPLWTQMCHPCAIYNIHMCTLEVSKNRNTRDLYHYVIKFVKQRSPSPPLQMVSNRMHGMVGEVGGLSINIKHVQTRSHSQIDPMEEMIYSVFSKLLFIYQQLKLLCNNYCVQIYL